MFKAIVLACAISATSDCIEFHDTRGPYQSKEACEERAYEMARDIPEAYDDLMPVKWRCQPLAKGMLA